MRQLSLVVIAVLVGALGARSLAADGSSDAADQLALDVWKASGGENWNKVKRIRFTFRVEDGDKVVANAQHDWDVLAGTDHVVWKDKDVTVNIASPAADEAGKAAYGRWVNDAYWLLAPLKIRDRGVKVTDEGTKVADGQSFQALRLSFATVGLTPGDQYVLYIDPQTKLVRAWDYIPKPETVMHGTWDKYGEFGGLKLSTEHNFAGKTIRLTDIQVLSDK